MEDKISSELIIDILRQSIILRKETKIKDTKTGLINFIEYIRTKFIDQDSLSQQTFLNFYNNPSDIRLAGKFETWIDIALRDSRNDFEELSRHLNMTKDILNPDLSENISKDDNFIERKNGNSFVKDDGSGVKHPIIVPWDFSDMSWFALNNALIYAKATGEEILLLHVANNDKDIDEVSGKLFEVADSMSKKSELQIEYMVETGNILKTITQVANDNNAGFVIMGTHGIVGMQRFTGSLALKVINGTNQPFVVVQANPVSSTIKTIAFPVGKTYSRHRLKQAKEMRKYFDLRYVLIMPEYVLNKNMEERILKNLEYSKKYMLKHNIRHEISYVKGTDSCINAVMKYIEDSDVDIIMMEITGNNSIQDYVLGTEEQQLITNRRKVPVMCINTFDV